jgi:hypothetical protein
MSIVGRNLTKGSTVQVYRPQKTEGSGGQQARIPVKLLVNELIELVPIADEVAVRIFGEAERVEVTAMVELWKGIQKSDVFAVTAGTYAEKLFVVVAARPLGRYQELGLAGTIETLGLPEGETP